MTTDFTYGKKQIVSGGPFKPSGKDMPVDARTRVESYADIASIPNPHIGLKITVKVDETNNNKMTDYIVIAVPASKNYTVSKDNGIGGKVSWAEDTAGANGVDITINNVACKLYGEVLLSQGKYYFNID